MSPDHGISFDGGMNATTVITAAPVAPSTPSGAATLVAARDLTRIWGKGDAAQIGIDGVDLDIRQGELLAIIGPSGSGKSTLGSLVAGIDNPTRGSVVVGGTRIDRMKSDRLAAWRSANVGIVFQDFHLLPTLTAVENVELALEFRDGRSGRRRRRRSRAMAALEQVGMTAHARKLPAQLSGGEQQRVGVARATVTDAPLLVADEPTGALDQANGHAVFDLLRARARAGTTVVVITHDLALAHAADRTVAMLDGRIDTVTHGSTNGAPS